MNKTFILALIASCASAACSDPVPSYKDGKVLFDYRSLGDDWGTVNNSKFPVCGTGQEQSPIDLKWNTKLNSSIGLISAGYFDIGIDSKFDSKDVEKKVNFDSLTRSEAGMYLAFADNVTSDKALPEYNPLQFHFHAPSEHSIDGELMDLEVHFVHTLAKKADSYAVVGFFFDVEKGGNKENPFITSLLNAMKTPGANVQVSYLFDEMGQDMEFWSYNGSFTTPPCTEGVKWNVVKKVYPISAAQLKEFTDPMTGADLFTCGKGNNRRVQPLNKRTLTLGGTSTVMDRLKSSFHSFTYTRQRIEDHAANLNAGVESTLSALEKLKESFQEAQNIKTDQAANLFVGAAATITAIAALSF